jgi:hypothetical protein
VWRVACGVWRVAGEKNWNRGELACGIDILDYRKTFNIL